MIVLFNQKRLLTKLLLALVVGVANGFCVSALRKFPLLTLTSVENLLIPSVDTWGKKKKERKKIGC